MKSAAKRRNFFSAFIALALLFCASHVASANVLEISKTRAELKTDLGQNRVSESLFYSVKRGENYDSLSVIALESSVAPGGTPADFADEAAEIMDNAARSRGLNPSSGIRAAMEPRNVDTSKLIPPSSRPFADPNKLARHGDFDWDKYTPIIVETDGTRMWVMDGMTRIENARRAGITELPAYVYPRR